MGRGVMNYIYGGLVAKYLLLILSVCKYSLGVQFPLRTRVNSVEVILLPKIENVSVVPWYPGGVGSPMVILKGEGDFRDGVRVVLTKESGFRGQVCRSKSFVSPVVKKFVNSSESERLLKFQFPLSGVANLSDLSNVWVCLGEGGSEGAHNDSWVHQGEASNIDVSILKDHQRKKHQSDPSQPLRRDSETPPSESVERPTNKGKLPMFLKIPESIITENAVARTKMPTREQSPDFRTSSVEPINLDVSLNKSYSTKSVVSEGTTEYGDRRHEPLALSLESGDLSRLSRNDRDIRPKKETLLTNAISENLPSNIEKNLSTEFPLMVSGIRVESHSKGISYEDGVIQLQANHDATIIMFGQRLTKDVAIQFTAKEEAFGGRCDISTTKIFQPESAYGHYAEVKVRLPPMASGQSAWYICLRESPEAVAVHQGTNDWLKISTYTPFLPLWIQVIILIFLLMLSGLFSGLNLGLMALDKTELKIVMNTGTPTERSYAKSIEPVRRHGNFLLCTLLLGNVLVNSSLTILLDNLSSGLIAVIGSTIGIVIFGEIVPQAICSRHGLAIGAKTVWLVRIFMVITGIVSWPVSKILDILLGEEIGNTYDRERLKELIRVTQDRNDIRLEEQNIIYGALELHRKTVSEVMTKLDDIFMLNIDRSLDFNTINEIMQQGYSRIPIYEGERTNIVSLLLIKDLAFIDPDDNTPLRTVIQFYQNTCNFVFEDTTLDVIFKEFKEGNKGHMAFVQRVNSEGECDPFYEVIGLVTLEDVIEELIQEEIVDETDVFTDNKSKRRRKHIRRDFKEFSQQNNQGNQKKVQISPQMQVAAFQYLRTSVEAFKEGNLSEGILKRMLNQDIIHVIKNDDSSSQTQNFIFSQGKAVDFFVLILEGHVEVTIGKENLTFESGPFTYFGLMALSVAPLGESPSLSTQLSRSSIVGSVQSLDSSKFCFTPDYSVKASTEVTYLKVKRSHYIAARRAYLLEQSQKDPLAEETFEKEMEKILRDESLTSPVWEVNSDRNEDCKDSLLNGGAIVSKEEDQIEMSIVADGRRLSLRETLVVPKSALSTNNSPDAPESETNSLLSRPQTSTAASNEPNNPDSSSPTTVCI